MGWCCAPCDGPNHKKVGNPGQAAWEERLNRKPVWEPVEIVQMAAKGKAVLTKQDDGSIFVTGDNPTPEVYTIKAKSPLVGITAVLRSKRS